MSLYQYRYITEYPVKVGKGQLFVTVELQLINEQQMELKNDYLVTTTVIIIVDKNPQGILKLVEKVS